MLTDTVYPFNKLIYFEAHISIVDTIISDTLESVILANTSTKVIIGKKIKYLAIKDGMITELTGIPNVEHLELINCRKITDISYLNKLTSLYAKDSTIDKFYSKDLIKLYIQGTDVIELPHPLTVCKEADISRTQITDIKHLSNVEVLNISYTNITDISALKAMKCITVQSVDINIYRQLCTIKTLEKIYTTRSNYIAVYN
jgi:Leucine-rich repeat (LRR) protein